MVLIRSEIIIKQPPNSARFTTVTVVKVLVTSRLKARIKQRIQWITNLLLSDVKMLLIGFIIIIRRQITSAAKPLIHHLPTLIIQFKIAVIGMYRRHIR